MYDRLDLLSIVGKAHTKPVCAEVGVYRGQYARRIYDALNPLSLALIDPWGAFNDGKYTDYPKNDRDAWDRMFHRVSNSLGTLPGVSLIRGLSIPTAALYPDAMFDFVYVDADHAYDSVKADLLAWLPKVRPGGFIGGHDIDQPQVRKAVYEVIGALSPQTTSKSGLKSYLARV